MTRNHQPSATDAFPQEVQQHIRAAQSKLEKATQTLTAASNSAAVQSALGCALSATRSLKRACEALKNDKLEG